MVWFSRLSDRDILFSEQEENERLKPVYLRGLVPGPCRSSLTPTDAIRTQEPGENRVFHRKEIGHEDLLSSSSRLPPSTRLIASPRLLLNPLSPRPVPAFPLAPMNMSKLQSLISAASLAQSPELSFPSTFSDAASAAGGAVYNALRKIVQEHGLPVCNVRSVTRNFDMFYLTSNDFCTI